MSKQTQVREKDGRKRQAQRTKDRPSKSLPGHRKDFSFHSE